MIQMRRHILAISCKYRCGCIWPLILEFCCFYQLRIIKYKRQDMHIMAELTTICNWMFFVLRTFLAQHRLHDVLLRRPDWSVRAHVNAPVTLPCILATLCRLARLAHMLRTELLVCSCVYLTEVGDAEELIHFYLTKREEVEPDDSVNLLVNYRGISWWGDLPRFAPLLSRSVLSHRSSPRSQQETWGYRG